MGAHGFTHAGTRHVYHVAHPGEYLRSPEPGKHFTMVYPEPVVTGPSYVDANAELPAGLVDHLSLGMWEVAGGLN